MLGSFAMSWEGKRIALSRSGDTQMEAALKLLLHYHRSGVTRSQLIDCLFADRDVNNTTHSLNVILHNLSKKLQQAGLPACDYIQCKNNVYFWTEEIPVFEDAERFERLYQEAEECLDIEKRRKLFWEACSLYSGEFLRSQCNTVWILQEAIRYERMFEDCVEKTAELLRENGDVIRLEKLGRFAAAAEPFSGWERLTMEALIEQGRSGEAKNVYLSAEQYYRSQMSISPDQKMFSLYQSLSEEDQML